MTERYPETEPYASGLLAVGDGHEIHWETVSDPTGVPAVYLHGGPGSGCGPGHRRTDIERLREHLGVGGPSDAETTPAATGGPSVSSDRVWRRRPSRRRWRCFCTGWTAYPKLERAGQ